MFKRFLALLVLSIAAVACATPGAATPAAPSPSAAPPSSSPAPSTPPSVAPTPTPSTATSSITLHRAPADLGCDTIGVDYTSMTFHIDPAATEQVTVVTDKGATLTTYWSDGFVPGSDTERVIRDAAGKLVVSDGDVLAVPPAAYPRLAGYFVCLGTDKIYVLAKDPS